ncbi:MAG: L,D-transpeptidase family protein [Sedimenticolaceae bacterium]
MRTLFRPLILALLLSATGWAHALAPTDEYIRQYSERILEDGDITIAGQRIASTTLLPDFYARRGFVPVWTARARFEELLELLRLAEDHGLNPDDYHYPTLASLPDSMSPDQTAARDVLATDALIRFAHHLHLGKVDPARLDPDWNLDRRMSEDESVDILEQAVAAPSLTRFVDTRLAPDSAFYAGLRQALARYRALAGAGGWPLVPNGPTLHPGDQDARVLALRTRLAVTDPALDPNLAVTDPALDPNLADPTLFDAGLAAAVERFQRQHGLDVDGVVGSRTMEALNVPVEARIDQLRVNLERTRWVFRDLESRFLVVNIAGFEAYLMDNGQVVWDSRVQVGKPYRKTPVFKEKMTYLVLSPTWTVPPTILKEDVIPKIRKNPSYLAENNMVLLDRAGQRVDLGTVDLKSIGPNNFPYTVRQEPGPKNALGRIKFMLPNKHAVYLHDTPNRSLFHRAERTTSSGCIRVQEPMSLAATLLGDPVAWIEAKIEERIARAQNETVTLKNPVMVYLMYWTSVPDGKGDARFFSDVYSRDQAVLDALGQPFGFNDLRQVVRPDRG